MKHLAKILPVFLALAMLFGLGCSVNAESITSADATTMRLMRTDGTVLLSDGSGSLSVQEGMRLFSGYALSTEALSRAGIMLDSSLSPAEKLKVVQGLMEDGDERAAKVYESLGCYLAHTLALYYDLYAFKHVLLLGRVMSGKGGDLLLETCKTVLAEDYPALNEKIHLALPDEKFRRVGQSAAAASLPEA